jgi:hypothetical protein
LSGAPRRSLDLLSLVVDLRDRSKIRKKLPNSLLSQLLQRLRAQRLFLGVEGGAIGGHAIVDALDDYFSNGTNRLAHRV